MRTAIISAYLAGIVDGEGYIGIKKHAKKSQVAPSFSAKIQVRMVDEPAIAFLAKHCGGSYWRQAAESGKRRPLYCYQATDAHAERILRRLLPFLRVKLANAKAVLRFRKWQSRSRKHRTKPLGTRQFAGFRGGVRTVRVMGLSDKYIAVCEAAWLECKRLNGRGPR